MKNYTDEELTEKYEALPEGVREAMFGADLIEIIEELKEKYKLPIDKMGELSNETRMVMFGLAHPKDFIGNIASRLEIEREQAAEIGKEINQRIFSKIKEDLKKIHNIRDENNESRIVNNESRGKPETESRITNNELREPETTEETKPEEEVKMEFIEPKPDQQEKTKPAHQEFEHKHTDLIEKPKIESGIMNDELREKSKTTTEEKPKIELGMMNDELREKPEEETTPKIEATPFEHKLEEGKIFRAPAQKTEHEIEGLPKHMSIPSPEKDRKYPSGDPYHEPIE